MGKCQTVMPVRDMAFLFSIYLFVFFICKNHVVAKYDEKLVPNEFDRSDPLSDYFMQVNDNV